MIRPTIRLHFHDGTHEDTYYSTYYKVIAGEQCTYRTLPKFHSAGAIKVGDTLEFWDEEKRWQKKVVRKEDLGAGKNQPPKV